MTDGCIDGNLLASQARHPQHERHLRDLEPVAIGVAQAAVLEKALAVICQQDDCSVVAQTARCQPIDQRAETLIEVFDFAVIEPAQLLPARRGHRQFPLHDGGQDDAVRALANGRVKLALHIVFGNALVIDVGGVRLEGD